MQADDRDGSNGAATPEPMTLAYAWAALFLVGLAAFALENALGAAPAVENGFDPARDASSGVLLASIGFAALFGALAALLPRFRAAPPRRIGGWIQFALFAAGAVASRAGAHGAGLVGEPRAFIEITPAVSFWLFVGQAGAALIAAALLLGAPLLIRAALLR